VRARIAQGKRRRRKKVTVGVSRLQKEGKPNIFVQQSANF